MLSPHISTLLRSGSLVLDTNLRQVRSGARVVPLSGLPLRILEMLVEANGRLVSRTELKAKLWPYAVRIDVDRRLNTAVRALRKALENSGGECGRIMTVRGHGYRWLSPRPSRPAWTRPFVLAGVAIAVLATLSADLPKLSGESGAQAEVQAADLKLASWDWRGAETLYRAAVRRNSNLTDARRGLAWLYVNEGRVKDAIPHIARLMEFPDRGPARRAELGWLLMRAGKPDAALAICARPDETNINLLSCRQTALAQLGLIDEARDTAIRILRADNADERIVRAVADAAPTAGYALFLRWRVAHFVAPGRDWFQRAQLQAEAGQLEPALRSLEVAAARRDPLLVKIQSTAAFAPLRSSPRFQRISEMVRNKNSA